MFQFVLGIGLAAFVLGGLDQRTGAQQDLLPAPLGSVIIAIIFALAALPRRWSIVPRVLLPIPTFLLVLVMLTGRSPPMPFFVSFIMALGFSLFVTAYAAYLAERPEPSTIRRG